MRAASAALDQVRTASNELAIPAMKDKLSEKHRAVLNRVTSATEKLDQAIAQFTEAADAAANDFKACEN